MTLPLLYALLGCSAGVYPLAPGCHACLLGDEHQYRYEAELDAEIVPMAAGTDGVVRWDELSVDLHGHPRDPGLDIDIAQIVAFRDHTPADVLEGLADDDLDQADLTLYVSCTPRDARCALSDFGLLGGTVDLPRYFQEGAATWLLLLGTPLEKGAAAFVFLDPRDASATTEVAIDDETSRLDVSVDLASLEPLVVAANEAVLELDWAGVSRDGLGNHLYPRSVDSLFLGRYDRSAAELADRVFDLEALAVERWEMPLAGEMTARLDQLVGETEFYGVTTGSTWILALRCSTCLNPAPRLVALLEPRAG